MLNQTAEWPTEWRGRRPAHSGTCPPTESTLSLDLDDSQILLRNEEVSGILAIRTVLIARPPRLGSNPWSTTTLPEHRRNLITA